MHGQIPDFFFKAQVSFPSNFAPIFNAIKHNSSVLFCSNIIYFGQQMSILKQQVNSLSDFHHSSVSLHITPLQIFSSCIFYFGQKNPMRVPILTLSGALMKICHLMSFSKPQANFFFRLCMTLLCHKI